MSGIPDDIKLHIVPLNITGGLGIGLSGGLIVDAGLNDINIGLDPLDIKLEPLDIKLEPLDIKIEPLDIKIEPLKITLDPIKVDLGLDNINVCLSLALTQLPRMQLHFPTKYDFGFSMFGCQVLGFSICGESSFITEDNPPRVFRKVEPEQRTNTGGGLVPVGASAPFKVVLP